MKKNISILQLATDKDHKLYNNCFFTSILKHPLCKTDLEISFAAEHWTQGKRVFWKSYLLYSLQLQLRTLTLIEVLGIPSCHLVNRLVKNSDDICLYKQT